MKVKKMKLMATIGALGLTAGVLGACGQTASSDDDDYVKVVDSEGNTVYVDEDELEDTGGGHGGGMFILFSNWNGNNHSALKSSKGFKGKTLASKPKASSSGFGKSSSGSKSGGFGG